MIFIPSTVLRLLKTDYFIFRGARGEAKSYRDSVPGEIVTLLSILEDEDMFMGIFLLTDGQIAWQWYPSRELREMFEEMK